MATEADINDYFNHAYHTLMRDGTVAAIGREAIKDARNTVHEFFFGRGERGGEPGAPLNPLYVDIDRARQSHESTLDALSAEPQATEAAVPPLPSEEKTAVAASPEHEQASVHGRAGGGIQGPEHGVYGPERGVYGPEHGVPSRDGVIGPPATGPPQSPGQIANDVSLDDPPQERGSVHGQEAEKETGQGAPTRDNAASAPQSTPGDIANDKDVGEQQDRGQSRDGEYQIAQRQPVGPFTEREAEREKAKQGDNAGNDQNERAEGRVLHIEQQEQDRGRGGR